MEKTIENFLFALMERIPPTILMERDNSSLYFSSQQEPIRVKIIPCIDAPKYVKIELGAESKNGGVFTSQASMEVKRISHFLDAAHMAIEQDKNKKFTDLVGQSNFKKIKEGVLDFLKDSNNLNQSPTGKFHLDLSYSKGTLKIDDYQNCNAVIPFRIEYEHVIYRDDQIIQMSIDLYIPHHRLSEYPLIALKEQKKLLSEEELLESMIKNNNSSYMHTSPALRHFQLQTDLIEKEPLSKSIKI